MINDTQRLQELDLLRGFALFGMLFMNVQIFSFSLFAEELWASTFSGSLNNAIMHSIFLLVAQRFIGIFSLLFGIGIAIQKQKFENNNISFTPYYLKRTLILGIFGAINLVFFFWGDILLIYSILSIILLLFFRLSNTKLIISAICVFLIPKLLLFNHGVVDLLVSSKDLMYNSYTPETIIDTYQAGSFFEMTKARITEYLAFNLTEIIWLRTSLAFMIIGYVIGKNKLHQNYLSHWNNLKKALFILTPLCLIYIIYNQYNFIIFRPEIYYVMLSDIFIIGSLTVYILFILAIFKSNRIKITISLISNIGKLSLSNYLMQQIICAFIFHNYGLGLYFKTSPFHNVLIILSIYILQMILSNLYLKKYNIGPLEYLWRQLTKQKLTSTIRKAG